MNNLVLTMEMRSNGQVQHACCLGPGTRIPLCYLAVRKNVTKGLRWSATAKGILCSTINLAIFTSTLVTWQKKADSNYNVMV